MPLADEDRSTSWAESIRAYDQGRRTLGWQANEFQPVQKVGNAERKAMERELDPVVMKFRDPAKEAARTSRKSDQMTATLTRYEGICAGRRNIINGTGGPPKTPPPQRAVEKRDNHIISNMSNAAYEHCPILYDDDFVEQNRVPRRIEVAHRVPGREMDIISNKYFHNDKERKDAEYIELRDTCIDRYWKGRDVNTVLQTYYRDDKEDKYQTQRQICEKLHGGAKMRRLPLSIRYSEGASYDIINHAEGDDPEKLKTALTMQIRNKNRQKRARIEGEIKKQGQALYDTAENRKLERVRYERYKSQMERGYDPLKFEDASPFGGHQIRQTRPLTSWDKIGGGVSGNGAAHSSSRAPPISARSNNDFGTTGGAPTSRSQPSTSRGSARGLAPVPSLDLTKTNFGEKVSYTEPVGGAPGAAVKMSVRTGGRL